MIKAVLVGNRNIDGTPCETIVIGMSDENLQLLREDVPIIIDGREIDHPEIDIVVFTGRTDQSMFTTLIKAGLVEDFQ